MTGNASALLGVSPSGQPLGTRHLADKLERQVSQRTACRLADGQLADGQRRDIGGGGSGSRHKNAGPPAPPKKLNLTFFVAKSKFWRKERFGHVCPMTTFHMKEIAQILSGRLARHEDDA